MFVAVATFLGNAVGTAEMKGYESANGDSRQAAQILDGAKYKNVASEVVLVQSRSGTLTATDSAFRQAVIGRRGELRQAHR